MAALFLFIIIVGSSVLAPWKAAADYGQHSEFSQGVEYSLLMSRNDKVCKHVLGLFNKDLAEFGTAKYGDHEEFRSIGWEKTTATYTYDDREFTESLNSAHIDINGTKDLVFRYTGFLRGYEIQTLYIFEDHAPTEKQWTLAEIARSPGRISHHGYVLDQEPSAAKRRNVPKFLR